MVEAMPAAQAILKDAATRTKLVAADAWEPATRARPMVEATPAAQAMLKDAGTRTKLVAADAWEPATRAPLLMGRRRMRSR